MLSSTPPQISSLVVTAAIGTTLPDATGPHRAPACASAQDAVQVDTFPSSPPPEVLDAIATAAASCRALAAAGQSVRFGIDAASGRINARLTDSRGATLRHLTPTDVLGLAAGDAMS